MEDMIYLWIHNGAFKVKGVRVEHTLPKMSFHKIRRTTMDDSEKVFIAMLEKQVLDSSKGRVNGIHNHTSVRVECSTDTSIYGVMWVTLYDGYYYLSLGVSVPQKYTKV